MKAPRKTPALVAGIALVIWPRLADACAVCFGKTDSPLGEGMNWGILVLLGFIGAMLGVICLGALFMARRAAWIAREAEMEGTAEPSEARIET